MVAAAGHRVAGGRLERSDDPVVADDLVGGADDEDVVEAGRGSSTRARPATRRRPRRRSPRRSRRRRSPLQATHVARSTSGLPIAASDQSMTTIRSSTIAALSEWKSPWTRLTGNGSSASRRPRRRPGPRRPPAASSASVLTARSGPTAASAAANAPGIEARPRSCAPAARRRREVLGPVGHGPLDLDQGPGAGRQRRRPVRLRQAPDPARADVLDQEPALLRLDREHAGTSRGKRSASSFVITGSAWKIGKTALRKTSPRPSGPERRRSAQVERPRLARQGTAGVGSGRAHPVDARRRQPGRAQRGRRSGGGRRSRSSPSSSTARGWIDGRGRPGLRQRPEGEARRRAQLAGAGSVVTSVGIGSPSGTPAQRGWTSRTASSNAPVLPRNASTGTIVASSSSRSTRRRQPTGLGRAGRSRPWRRARGTGGRVASPISLVAPEGEPGASGPTIPTRVMTMDRVRLAEARRLVLAEGRPSPEARAGCRSRG